MSINVHSNQNHTPTTGFPSIIQELTIVISIKCPFYENYIALSLHHLPTADIIGIIVLQHYRHSTSSSKQSLSLKHGAGSTSLHYDIIIIIYSRSAYF